MSTLQERIQQDLTTAMRERDEARKSALRMLLAAIKNAQIEARHPLDDAAVLAVLQKDVKQHRESATEFQKGNRPDLVAKEEEALAILQQYLPAQATPEELEAAARKVVAETGAAGPRDIGKVMPVLTKQFAGRADGRQLSEIVRALLGG